MRLKFPDALTISSKSRLQEKSFLLTSSNPISKFININFISSYKFVTNVTQLIDYVLDKHDKRHQKLLGGI